MSWNPMTLGGVAFQRDPNSCTDPREQRFTSVVRTYGGIVFFSWGLFLEGVEIELKWRLMPETMFNQLQTLLEADEEMVWDPKSGTTYNVQIRSLEGSYVETSLLNAPWREDVTLKMVIISEV